MYCQLHELVVIKTLALLNKTTFQVESDISCCRFSFPLSHFFQACHLSFIYSSNDAVEVKTYVQSKKHSAFLVLFLSERGWGD